MTVQTCMLAMIRGGQSEKATAALWEVEEVKAAHSVTGIYEMTAFEGVEDLAALGQLVISKIQAIESVVRTHTCVVIWFSSQTWARIWSRSLPPELRWRAGAEGTSSLRRVARQVPGPGLQQSIYHLTPQRRTCSNACMLPCLPRP